MDYARHEYRLNKRESDGQSLRDHLEAVERQTGIRPEELDGPDFPSLMSYVWSAFLSLSSSRNPALSGVAPITYEQIKAWTQVTGNPLSPREVDAIKRLDYIFMEEMNG